MSENQNRGSVDFTQYDAMTTEELEALLRSDAEMTGSQESDTEKILYIMEVLTERKRKNGHTGNTAQEAYESFKQNYMPETDGDTASPKTKRGNLRWVRDLAAAAAVLAVLLAGSVTAKAFGFDLWQAVVQWTQETFHFGGWGKSDADNSMPYASLQEALEEGKITAPLAPTWFPTGYELSNIKVEMTPQKKTYKARYTCGEKVILIAVRDYLDGEPVYVEQSDGLVEKYEDSGITYYLFENNEQVHSVWIVDSYECYISGNITIDELKMMIRSIEKGEH